MDEYWFEFCGTALFSFTPRFIFPHSALGCLSGLHFHTLIYRRRKIENEPITVRGGGIEGRGLAPRGLTAGQISSHSHKIFLPTFTSYVNDKCLHLRGVMGGQGGGLEWG